MPSADSASSFSDQPFGLEILGASLPGACSTAVPLAVARTGGIGILNLAHHADASSAAAMAAELSRLANGRVGLMLAAPLGNVEAAALGAVEEVELILFFAQDHADLDLAVETARPKARRVGAIVTSRVEAERAVAVGCDLLIAKGHEAGGIVGEETSFVLVQSLRAAVDVPIYVWGGVSWNTAAACAAAGCAGVLLDWQLALLRESPLGAAFRRRLAMMDGSEVATVPLAGGKYLRFYHQPGLSARAEVERLCELTTAGSATAVGTEALIRELPRMVEQTRERDRLWLTGQDACLAADWARQAPSVGRAMRLLAERVETQIRAAAEAKILDAGSPLANSHGTKFPVVQGPMTRVSDVPEFCHAVSANGGLPFLALALLGGEQVRKLLAETKQLLGDLPWGVGMLGFVPQEIRAQQWPVIQEYRPPFAVIAGGRPDQAASLEASGIATYLHVPSPGMLDMFLREGARRFVFEGRECGGHVGPRTSFVLWELMIRVLCEAKLSAEEAAKVHVLFAGGIHDRVGAAMVSVLAQPLVERGMKVGVLLGTAYLFTEEIVSTKAIVEGFQSVAVELARTVVVESGPGHAVRCAENDFVELFDREKRRMIVEQRPAEEMRAELEHLNLGRLRIAAKGVQRGDGASGLQKVHANEQRREGMYMIGQVAALRRGTCTLRELHEEVCLGAVEMLATRDRVEVLPVSNGPEPKPLDIAVIGMACMVPGATNPAQLWHNVIRKFDPITEIPADRFEVDRWFDADKKARDKIYNKWGGFVDDLPFDPLKYGIPPASIPSIEPMQLLAMELVDRAMTDAGYAPDNPHKERTSVILGVGGGAGELGSTYAFRAMLPRFLENPDETVWQQLPEWTEDSFAGILFNVVAGRVSNRFDFGGANCTIDAACASSLAALYWACQELVSGRSDVVVTGGCDTMQNPFGYLCFAKAGALSPRGRARVFDAESDGIVISEGHAAVVLKRREDAERDGDKIYAVIRAVAGASDGRSKGLTAPRVEGQIRTLRRAYEQSGIDPRTVALFEAHGTGTAVGDQTEALALSTMLRESGVPTKSVAVGSIKSMIGHTKCAAGAVGLIKTIMALQHRVLPPTMHVEHPNPKGGLVDGPLFVNADAQPWLQADGPRRAGVSSFGFGGTNFHVLLEEYDRSAVSRPMATRRDRAFEVFVLRADMPSALKSAAASLAKEASAVESAQLDSGLARLSYTHHLRTQSLEKSCQLAVVAGSLTELSNALNEFAKALDDQGAIVGKLPANVCYSASPLGKSGRVAFLFPGQGSQHPGMLRELAIEFPEVFGTFQRADVALRPQFGELLSQSVFPPTPFTAEERASDAERLKDTRRAQPALGVSGWAMSQLLASFAVRPDMTAGHSFGELVALADAGAMSESELFQLAAARGDAMSKAGDGERGAMLAVAADAAEVAKHLTGLSEVWVANLNSPKQTVLSGTEAGIVAALAKFETAKVSAKRIPVSAAFHSPFMQAPRKEFNVALDATAFQTPTTPVYSNVTAEKYSGTAAEIRTRLAEQLTSEVRWVEQIENMYRDGARVFVEVGPKGVLSGLVRDILGKRPHVAIATQPSGDASHKQFLLALGQLIAQGVEVSLDRLHDDRPLEPLTRAELSGTTPALASHLWLVNGAYSRKVGTPKRVTAPQARLAGPPSTTSHVNGEVVAPVRRVDLTASSEFIAPSTNGHKEHTNGHHTNGHGMNGNGHATHVSKGHSPAAPNPIATGQTSGNMDADSYAQFQETMRQFLLTQESVLGQLFGHGAMPATPIFAPAPVTAPLPAPRVEIPVAARIPEPVFAPTLTPGAAPVAVAEPLVAAPVAKPVAVNSIESLVAQLTNVVADRTGYPAEMLNLDINLESELGIDSIKRVEIIAAFRREVLPDMLEPPAEFMERLTGAKTMRQIVDVMADMSVPSTPATSTEPTPRVVATSESAALDPDDLLSTLLKIVADRTGYPAEMLDLDINLEAELGIDSIKRVEIIAAFRREVLPAMQEPPAEFMERLATARTMRAIIEVVAEMSGGQVKEQTKEVAAVAPASPAIDLKQLEATLARIVADRTGYPPEMLGLEINLESELGIDSIKRVEIIAAFRREVRPEMIEPPAELMERLSAAKSMQAILDCFAYPSDATTTKPTRSASPETPSTKSSLESSDSTGCPRSVADVVEIPLGHLAAVTAGTVLLVCDSRGISSEFGKRLSGRGLKIASLSAQDLVDRETAKAAVERIRAASGPIVAAAHLLPLEDCPAWPGISPDVWQERFDSEVRGLLFLLQALEPELSKSTGAGLRVLCAEMGGGDFTTNESAKNEAEASRPWRGGLAGLLKVAACEWPQHAFRLVNVAETPTAELLEQELLAAGPVEIGYRDGKRLCLQTKQIELPEPEQSKLLDRDSVVLVTGGAKGITAQIVATLAAKAPARFVLMGRSPLPTGAESATTASIEGDAPLRKAIIEQLRAEGMACTPAAVEAKLSRIKSDREVRRNVAAIQVAGATVEYIQCDIRDATSLKSAVETVRTKFGAIHGILHGAGIIDDRMIKDKTAASFDGVVRTKIDPLLALLECVDLEQLRLVSLFASTSGFFGNSGQCDYAAANEVLNRIARRLRTIWPGKVMSFNWGPWAGAGMVTAEVAAKMRAGGVELIPLADGCAAACREILSAEKHSPRVILGSGPWLSDEKLRAGIDFSSCGPLLQGQKIESLGDGKLLARVTLERTSKYLDDHVIEGKAVLPVAMAVGLMAETAHLARPSWHVAAVENVRMLSGITVEGESREILVKAEPLSQDNSAGEWRVSISAANLPNRTLYDAHVHLAARLPQAPQPPGPAPIAAPLEATAGEAYDRWLFHGPTYQVIQGFTGADESGIDAVVRGGFARMKDGAVSPWVVDPVMVDAAPQLAMIWSRAMFDVAVLPNRISRYRVYEPLGEGDVEMKLRVRPSNDRQYYHADVWIVREGRVIAHMEGLEGAGSPQLNRIAASH